MLEFKNYIKKLKNTISHLKPKIVIKYPSYDKKKCLARRQNV